MIFTPDECRKLNELVAASREVITASAFPNGALVAANTGLEIFPRDAQDYLGVWPRDSSYTCMAADILGMKEIPEKFFEWCVTRCEGFKENGIFGTQHNLNGSCCGTVLDPEEFSVPKKLKKTLLFVTGRASQFQPDQNGSVIIAADHHLKHWDLKADDNPVIAKLMDIAADGLCNLWDPALEPHGGFTIPYWDCWEERIAEPGRHHLYSLAMCIRGLHLAGKHLGTKRYRNVEREMHAAFYEAYDRSEVLPRTFPVQKDHYRHALYADRDIDSLTDSSLFGLVWPSRLLQPTDEKMVATVNKILEDNASRGGLLRYPGDVYCGAMKTGFPTFTGGGPWIILSCFSAMYHADADNPKKAEEQIRWILKSAERYWPYLAEQVHKKDKPSIVPLTWSHAMLVIALDKLGFEMASANLKKE